MTSIYFLEWDGKKQTFSILHNNCIKITLCFQSPAVIAGHHNGWDKAAQYFYDWGQHKVLSHDSLMELTNQLLTSLNVFEFFSSRWNTSLILLKMAVGGCFCGRVRIEYNGQPLKSVSTARDSAFHSLS